MSCSQRGGVSTDRVSVYGTTNERVDGLMRERTDRDFPDRDIGGVGYIAEMNS